MAYLLENQGVNPSIGGLVMVGDGNPINNAIVGILDRTTNNTVHIKNAIPLIKDGKFIPKVKCTMSADRLSSNHEFIRIPDDTISNAYYLRLKYIQNR